ncbi:peptidoglycan DD-metalloendopeptidase family protein [Altererythrobacter soli]|uniref:Peptidoglycan DD-metalloendopeptidase family protein n=1 Tax=Croceibacterium soli TaxID=1739690 RepID=A0A6I4USV5_9SPHN|nr:M23 family metallopeptidase [Croceibacterium soli]MXP40844.1 peptidoglycan DD-metalloendopeptidase family protein [Croceibacterium soli]
MKLADRLLTIVVTVTLTSAVWILVGSFYIDDLGTGGMRAERRSAGAPAVGEGQAEPGRSVLPGESASLIIPVEGVTAAQLSDTFADDRGDGERLHEALDIMAPRGTPVIAAAPGTIGSLFQSEAGGNTIYVRSADRRTIHYYAHLDAYALGLQEGQQVSQGQRLGTVGFSGNASPEAPHLHFAILRTTPDAEWWEPATAINPYPLLTNR